MLNNNQQAHRDVSYDCAYFSELVYEENPALAVNPGWQYFSLSPDNHSGYRGVAYVNHNRRLLIIAHCGSRFHLMGNIKADIDIFFERVPEAFLFSRRFSRTVREMAVRDHLDYKVIETGHSLGGVPAQLNAYEHRSEAITFDNPGTLEIISNTFEGFNPQSIQAEKFIEYLSAPNAVNCLGTHIGKKYRVYVPHMSLEGHTQASLEVYKGLALLSFVFLAPFVIAGGGLKVPSNMSGMANMVKACLVYSGVTKVKDNATFEDVVAMAHPNIAHLARLHSIKNIRSQWSDSLGYPQLCALMETWPTLGALVFAQPYASMNRMFHAITDDLRPHPKRYTQNIAVEHGLSRIQGYIHSDNFPLFPRIGAGHAREEYVRMSCRNYHTFFGNEDSARYLSLRDSLCQQFQIDPAHLGDVHYYEDDTNCCCQIIGYMSCGFFGQRQPSPVPINPLFPGVPDPGHMHVD